MFTKIEKPESLTLKCRSIAVVEDDTAENWPIHRFSLIFMHGK